MAAPWEDVRDVLVRVGFGSPRPSTSSDEIIRVTRERPRGRGADGQRQKSDASASSSSRRRRRNTRSTRTSNSDTNSPTASMRDAADASTPLPIPRATNSPAQLNCVHSLYCSINPASVCWPQTPGRRFAGIPVHSCDKFLRLYLLLRPPVSHFLGRSHYPLSFP